MDMPTLFTVGFRGDLQPADTAGNSLQPTLPVESPQQSDK
jgi:hypothetical protein